MFRSMIRWLVLAVVSGAVGFGQTAVTEQSIAAKLQGPFVMLRGMYDGDKLSFDAQGNLIGSASQIPFALSFLKVKDVHLTLDSVEIDAIREGLAIKQGWEGRPDRATAEPIKDKFQVVITIACDHQHEELLDAALNRVFHIGFDDGLAQAAPQYWRPWITHELHPERPFPEIPVGVEKPTTQRLSKKPDAVLAPRLIRTVDPMTTEAARIQRLSGQSTLSIVVDEKGIPRDITIIRPLGMGLDEMAVLAVLQNRFTPAMKNGQPIPVAVNFEVQFR